MEQISLNLETPQKSGEAGASSEAEWEQKSTEDLEALYHESVGKDPRLRFCDDPEDERRKILIEGIMDKEKALRHLRTIDARDDRAARESHWSN